MQDIPAGHFRSARESFVPNGCQYTYHLCKLPALTFLPSLGAARQSAGRTRAPGVEEAGALLCDSKASPGVSGVRGEGLPMLGETTPVHGFAARAVSLSIAVSRWPRRLRLHTLGHTHVVV